MLSRVICKRCVKDEQGSLWNTDTDARWSVGYVDCPRIVKKAGDSTFWGLVRNDEETPEHCPYRLEHVVSDVE